MQEHHAILSEKLPAFGEEFEIMRRSHVLEHPNRNNPIECPFD